MGKEGFIYALINSSMPGLVKVGRSARGADERALELGGTGTSTPFVVIYEEPFLDSEAAEHFVHAALQSLGFRISPNREFFDATPKVVIDVIRMAKLGHVAHSRSAVSAPDAPGEKDRAIWDDVRTLSVSQCGVCSPLSRKAGRGKNSRHRYS